MVYYVVRQEKRCSHLFHSLSASTVPLTRFIFGGQGCVCLELCMLPYELKTIDINFAPSWVNSCNKITIIYM